MLEPKAGPYMERWSCFLCSPLSCFSPKVLQGRTRRGHPSKSTYLHICSDVGIFSRVLAGDAVVIQHSWKWTSGPLLQLTPHSLSSYLSQKKKGNKTKHYALDSFVWLNGHLKILIYYENFEWTYTCRITCNIRLSSIRHLRYRGYFFMHDPNGCNEASFTVRVFLSWLTHQVISFLLHLLARGLGRALGNPLSLFFACPSSPHTYTQTGTCTHTHTLLFAPSLLFRPRSSCEEHSAMFLLAELWRLSLRAWKTSQRAHFSHFLHCSLCERLASSLLTSSRLPSNAGQGGTNASSLARNYIHILPLSLVLCLQHP